MSTAREVMIIDADSIPRRYNVIAFVSSWLIHTSYLVVPGTFTSLGGHLDIGDSRHAVADTVKNVPLLPVAGLCCVVGSVGLGYLWHRWSLNFVWLTRNIFL
jgi:hypothetical protein